MVPDQDLEVAASCAQTGWRPATKSSATVNGMDRLAMNPMLTRTSILAPDYARHTPICPQSSPSGASFLRAAPDRRRGSRPVPRAIHRQSKRSKRVFFQVNCAAIPSLLIASELLGHGVSSGTTAKSQGFVAGRLLDTRAIKSSILDRNSFKTGDVFALLYPTTRSTVGTSPSKGRLMTDHESSPGDVSAKLCFFGPVV